MLIELALIFVVNQYPKHHVDFHKNLELGLDLSAKELAEEARKEYMMSISHLTKDATAEQIVKILDPEVLKKLRKATLPADYAQISSNMKWIMLAGILSMLSFLFI